MRDELKLGLGAVAVLKERYLLRDEQGRVAESTGEMMDRAAACVAEEEEEEAWCSGSAARWAETFASAMRRLEFLPNSSTLMNAGTRLGLLAGCVVLPVEDAPAFTRHILGCQPPEANPLFERLARTAGFYSEDLMAEVARTGTVRQIPGVSRRRARLVCDRPGDRPRLAPENAGSPATSRGRRGRQDHQPAPDATPADVRAIYTAAWRAGVKGITVYRYGARPCQVLTLAYPTPAPGTVVQIHDGYSGGCGGHACQF